MQNEHEHNNLFHPNEESGPGTDEAVMIAPRVRRGRAVVRSGLRAPALLRVEAQLPLESPCGPGPFGLL